MRPTAALRQVLIRAGEGIPTGITGLFKHPNPRPALITLYNNQLEILNKQFPKESVYRQSVEALTKNRLKIVEEEEITENIENKIGNGLIEELVIQAHDEIQLSRELARLKCWEELEEKPLDDQWVYFGKRI
ncbi:hypothetical protein LELG_00132 [Lodderomyces elongisporus NRRL YB-4239]|uniref:NADH-ubiquinone oxidoreductase 13 kDa-B subunit n=2 Tax=Lodderomyces elongisporus TaxID=36914 RepID=A5DRZ6_LODEL|nr:hypothetical protein LELG_00132 [Lodderomyces elongisporus NRRL YB-4239]